MPPVLFVGPHRLDSRRARRTRTALGVVLALLFFAAGVPKLLGTQMEREMFATWGYPEWFMYAVGAGEVVLGVLLLLPQTRFWGALLLCGEMVGAALTHVRVAEWMMLPVPLAIFALAAWLAWLERPVIESARCGRAPYGYPVKFSVLTRREGTPSSFTKRVRRSRTIEGGPQT